MRFGSSSAQSGNTGITPRRLVRAGAVASVLALAACGSADDLKARWLELPTVPETLTHEGPGTPEIQDLDFGNMSLAVNDITFLDPFDRGVFPERTFATGLTPDGGYMLDFDSGEATLELGPEAVREGTATVSLSFDDSAIYYSDANLDGYQDAMIVLDQSVTYEDSDNEDSVGTGILLITYAGESGGDLYYFNPGYITSVSAIDSGFSMTRVVDEQADTIQLGMPDGVPVRIDQHGGSVTCTSDMDEIDLALEQEPFEVETLAPYPGVGEVAGYEEYALFEVPIDPLATNNLLTSGYVQVIFLLDGGDIHRWTDYRCGWVAADQL